MQQSTQMIPIVPSFPQPNITTEQIQKYLDENKKLILAILENQNVGKLAECAQYQAVLQKNLMYLAAVADAQPPPPEATAPMPRAMAPPQAMVPNSSMMPPPPSYLMQQPQQAMGLAQQISPGIFPPIGPSEFGNFQEPQQQLHQQTMQGHMGMSLMGLNNNNNGLQYPMHQPGTSLGANNGTSELGGGSIPDGTNLSHSGADGQHGSAGRHGTSDAKLKGIAL